MPWVGWLGFRVKGSPSRSSAPLLVATGVIAAGPAAAAQGHSARTRSTGNSYNFKAPTSAAVVGGHLFVTNGGNNTVTEVSASTGAFVAGISARRYKFQHPSAIVAVGTDLFVANASGNSVTELSATDLKHVRTIRRPKYHFADPVALASSGPDLFVLNGSGSMTEISAGTGALIGTVSGPAFGFHTPTGLAVADGKVFVANSTGNTLTVINAQTRALIGTLSGPSYGFDTPIGVAFDGTHVWVTNQSADSVTEISPTTLQALDVLVDTTNLPSVGPIIFGDEYVFTLSPPGGSPMVSQIQITAVAHGGVDDVQHQRALPLQQPAGGGRDREQPLDRQRGWELAHPDGHRLRRADPDRLQLGDLLNKAGAWA